MEDAAASDVSDVSRKSLNALYLSLAGIIEESDLGVGERSDTATGMLEIVGREKSPKSSSMEAGARVA